MSIDLEKHKANFRIIHKFEDSPYTEGSWYYFCQRKYLWFWISHYQCKVYRDAEEYLKRMISQMNPEIVKELYVK